MSIKEKMNGTFNTKEDFAQALSDGIEEELIPIKNKISELETTITNLQSQIVPPTPTS